MLIKKLLNCRLDLYTNFNLSVQTKENHYFKNFKILSLSCKTDSIQNSIRSLACTLF